MSDFLHTIIPKRRRIWGMSRAVSSFAYESAWKCLQILIVESGVAVSMIFCTGDRSPSRPERFSKSPPRMYTEKMTTNCRLIDRPSRGQTSVLFCVENDTCNQI
eukprot:UN14568